MTVFFSAPHRMMFLLGGLQLIATQVWWGLELLELGFDLNILPTVTVAPVFVHQFLMLYGCFGFFMFGFLMTTYPRWFQKEPLKQAQYIPCFVLMLLGIIGFYVGMFSSQELLAYGVVIFALGWGFSVSILIRIFIANYKTANLYEWLLNIILVGGFSGILAYGYWLYSHDSRYLIYSNYAGFWLFLIPLVFIIAHRMIPFFSNVVINPYIVYQPRWNLWLFVACVVGHFFCEMFTLQRWLIVFDLPMMVLAMHLSRRWQLKRSLHNRLLAMLHIAYAWLAIASVLFVVQSFGQMMTATPFLARAPIHAVGIGLVASMVIAIASRVSLGHSGRPLIADNLTWYCFLSLQIVALSRVLSEFPFVKSDTSMLLSILAAGIWFLAMTVWCIKYVPIWLLPRVDGKPG